MKSVEEGREEHLIAIAKRERQHTALVGEFLGGNLSPDRRRVIAEDWREILEADLREQTGLPPAHELVLLGRFRLPLPL